MSQGAQVVSSPPQPSPSPKPKKARACGHICGDCHKAYSHDVFECEAHVKRVCDACWQRYRQGFEHKAWIGHKLGLR